MNFTKVILKWILGAAFIFAGTNHFINPSFYLRMMPPFLPAPLFLINLSGVFEIVPVPVYYPEVSEILGRKVYRSLAEIPEDIDLVNIFRRSDDVAKHTEDILAKKPKAVWLQSGIRNDAVAETLAREGIKVVQDLCLMVEHRALER